MGLTTHVLDTHAGVPAQGMHVQLFSLQAPERALIGCYTLNAQGRTDAPLFADGQLQAGRYQLAFDVAGYFRARHVPLPEPPFLDWVSLEFGVADPSAHYHVPLLVSPWAYSTYRGS